MATTIPYTDLNSATEKGNSGPQAYVEAWPGYVEAWSGNRPTRTHMAPTIPYTDLNPIIKQVNPDLHVYMEAWVDNERGVTNDDQLSCWGPNITNSTITTKDGGPKPMIVRHENHDEMLGVIKASSVHCGPGLTLDHVLANVNEHLKYRNYELEGFGEEAKAKPVVMRFQEVVIPQAADGSPRMIAPANYSFQTKSEDDPRNLHLVVTPKGIFAHLDKRGYYELLAHLVSEEGAVTEHWFEAEESKFKPGQSQYYGEERDPKRAKAVPIGVAGSDASASAILVVSIPLKQKPPVYEECGYYGVPKYRSLSVEADEVGENEVYRSLSSGGMARGPVEGIARAARLNVGEQRGAALSTAEKKKLTFDDSGPVVISQFNYTTVRAPQGTESVTISEETAMQLARNIEKSLSLCDASCRLSKLLICLRRLTEEDMARIRSVVSGNSAKVDPYKPCENALSLAR